MGFRNEKKLSSPLGIRIPTVGCKSQPTDSGLDATCSRSIASSHPASACRQPTALKYARWKSDPVATVVESTRSVVLAGTTLLFFECQLHVVWSAWNGLDVFWTCSWTIRVFFRFPMVFFLPCEASGAEAPGAVTLSLSLCTLAPPPPPPKGGCPEGRSRRSSSSPRCHGLFFFCALEDPPLIDRAPAAMAKRFDAKTAGIRAQRLSGVPKAFSIVFLSLSLSVWGLCWHGVDEQTISEQHSLLGFL